jgi:iron complex outermembrane receptor protein
VAAVEPPRSTDSVVSGFVQGQLQVRRGLRLTGGTKLEYNDFSGVEVQPSGRAAWDITPEQMIWGAVSRAVRVPTRFERDFQADASPPGANPTYRLTGSSDFGSERLIAYEAGYRWKPRASLSIDLTAFENRYHGLASVEFGDSFTDPNDGRTIVPLVYENLTRGTARGIEALATFTPAAWWRVVATSSSLHLNLEPQGADLNAGALLEGRTPRHQLGVRSYLDLSRALQFDALFRHVTALRNVPGAANNELPGYAELDVRLAWRGWQQLEVSLVGQSLLHDHHAEFGPPDQRGEIPRGMYVRLAWGF